jgi:O-antigen/teichoic acid export membrane protein
MRHWGTRGAYSILDQALVSGANFALSVLYARWLSPDQYGLFAILLAMLLVAAGFHNALILEPMSVLGATQDKDSPYLSSLVVLHAIVAMALGLVIASNGVFFLTRNARIGRGLVVMGISLPLILSYWLLRRMFYLSGDARRAAIVSLVYAISLGASLLIPRRLLSPATGLASMALASLVASAVAWKTIKPKWCPEAVSQLLHSHWVYGKWVVGIAMLYWLTGPFFAPILGYYGGLASAANLRVADNLLAPLTQVIAALSLLSLPQLSTGVARSGVPFLRGMTARLSLLGFGLSGLYSLGVISGSALLFRLLYRTNAYNNAQLLLPLLCAAAIVRSLTDLGVAQSLRAAARPDAAFWAAATAALVTVTAGVPLVRSNGAIGAAAAMLLAGVAQGLVLFWRFSFLVREDRPQEAVRHAI